jgi:predicted Fe-Mo cluster-binding NifX family protein
MSPGLRDVRHIRPHDARNSGQVSTCFHQGGPNGPSAAGRRWPIVCTHPTCPEDRPLKLLVPAATDLADLAAPVAGHFGQAPFYAVVDTETLAVECSPNGAPDHSGPHQFPQMLGALLEPGRFDAVVCAGMGAPAVERMVAAGKSVHVAPAVTLGDAVRAFSNGEATPLSLRDAGCCGGHRH